MGGITLKRKIETNNPEINKWIDKLEFIRLNYQDIELKDNNLLP